ncbi:hypothetical protein HMPREF1222_01350 [Treponema vincentii F0403]|uniref:SH3b domain-containing protein n=1 Tax=Treponema vincentii F0403 TaxID=1125702 RepID=S3L8K6_9SPIR|nr:SH3 domain-containing protein [Treponema vincentii]EPF46773.1 hypothetical protein HMPREF1222_01350 [Treponema vincentii F0403]
MGKNATRIGTGDKRLLAFRRLIKPAILFLFCRAAAIFLFCCEETALYGQQSDNFIELKIDSTEFSIDRELEIEIIINSDAPYLQAYSDTPRFYLAVEGDAAAVPVQLVQSSAIPERDSLHLRYRYRFNGTGTFRFVPTLQWRKQTLELAPLDITVHSRPLSESTPFLWKLYAADGRPIPEDAAIEQGREYILCLAAAFYSAGYAERYLQVLQTASVQLEAARSEISHSKALRSQENQSGADSQAIGDELPLPTEILHIDCSPSESAALKPLALGELPFDAAVLLDAAGNPDAVDGSDTAVSPNAVFSHANSEHYLLAIFSIIPLRIGAQSLPQAQIFFASGGTAFSVPASYRANRQAAAQATGKGGADGFTAAAFQALPNETQYSGSSMTGQEKNAAAVQIAEYRKQEAASLFAPTISRERKKLETALEIAQPLPLYPRLLGVLTAVISILLLIGTAVCGLRNKKLLMLILLTGALCSGGFTVVMFRRILQPQGVYTGVSGDPAVRRIPENSGGTVYRLSAGESFIIVRQTPQWYYIKTAGGAAGWISPQSVIRYN